MKFVHSNEVQLSNNVKLDFYCHIHIECSVLHKGR
jgi:hypothetical protein